MRLQHSLCVYHTHKAATQAACLSPIYIYKPLTQPVVFLAQTYKVATEEHNTKIDKIKECDVNQGLVCPFAPKLCQNIATASRDPVEPLQTPNLSKNQKNHP